MFSFIHYHKPYAQMQFFNPNGRDNCSKKYNLCARCCQHILVKGCVVSVVVQDGRKRFLLVSVFGLMSPRVKSLSLGTFSQSTIVLPHFLEKIRKVRYPLSSIIQIMLSGRLSVRYNFEKIMI